MSAPDRPLDGTLCSYRGVGARCERPADTVMALVPLCWDHAAVQTAMRQWNGRLKREGLGVLPKGRTSRQNRQAAKGQRRMPR